MTRIIAMRKMTTLYRGLRQAFLLALPQNYLFERWRVNHYRKCGHHIGNNSSIAPNVVIYGRFEMGSYSSIASNCTINGVTAGVFIGDHVMIAPNCVIVAFDHGVDRTDIPMVQQPIVEAPVHIEDDVWIGANCTITSGVRIGTGSIVAANAVVVDDVAPFSVVGGVPARQIRLRSDMSAVSI